MYAISLASGLFLLDKHAAAVAVSAIGVILGWPFSILAFVPVTLYSLYIKFKPAFIAGAVTSVILLVSQILPSYIGLLWPVNYAYTQFLKTVPKIEHL
jgi:alpha-1,2-mannosyltransferase